MQDTNRNYAAIGPFVQALADLGIEHVCITPGSRSAPLAVTFAAHPTITHWMHHDERSSAFFALGIAKTTRRPAVVVTTSGTAAAEVFPAVVEAQASRTPLLILTADRPSELRDVAAPQTIDQVKMYGNAVRWFRQMPEPDTELIPHFVAAAAHAYAAALDEPAGPVHLNFPFREPLSPDPVPGFIPPQLSALHTPTYVPGRLSPDRAKLEELTDLLWGRRTLLVCGPTSDPELPAAAAKLAATGKFPVLADPLSGIRAGNHDLSAVISTAALLTEAGFLDRNPPEAVVRCGAPLTAKVFNEWLASRPEVVQIVIDTAEWRDPGAAAHTMLRGDPVVVLSELTNMIGMRAPEEWITRWIDADRAASSAVAVALRWEGALSEPGVAATLAQALPSGSTLWIASSMPIRDIDSYFAATNNEIRMLGHRGANGIDGLLSSALGSASISEDPVFVLAGDLTVLHDLTTLLAAQRTGTPVTIIVLNNNGGGIFHFLPHVNHPEYFEELFGTPHNTDFAELAAGIGMEAEDLATAADLHRALGLITDRPRLLQVRTDRERNVEVHRRVAEAVKQAIG